MKNRVENQFRGFLNTPALWKGKFEGISQFNFPPLPEQISYPSVEIPSLSTNFVLGKRMESFFEFLINSSKNHEILAANIQIHKDRITLGELDFLLKDLQNQQIVHLELVYKFYVYDPSFSSENERWIGPNRRDSFLQKINKLSEKQFPLLYKTETREFLKTLELTSEEIIQKTGFKANLFIPKGYQKNSFSQINPDCICGYWINFEQFNSNEYKNHQFILPQKQDWPIDPKYGENWISFDETREKILKSFNNKKSPLVWMRKSVTQFERLFVVWW